MSEKRVVYDPLTELMAYYADVKSVKREIAVREDLPIGERLKRRIIDGEKVGFTADLDLALKKYSPLSIINEILLEGMKVVGELFGAGQMQLPFVLQSAEAMKSAVAYLEKFMEKTDSASKGKIVLATVKGDVHDIGKNLVDIILTNNGFTVYNLGIKVGVEQMLERYEKESADAIGMSGLLVKSTLIMKENLEVIKERNLKVPVILGGAALTRRYVENDLQKIYGNYVSYAQDAFDGLRFMNNLLAGKFPSRAGGGKSNINDIVDEESLETLVGSEAKTAAVASREDKSSITEAARIPKPPFWGSKIVDEINIETVYQYVNETALFRGQWQFRKKGKTDEEYNRLLEETVIPLYNAQKAKAKQYLEPKVVYGYFPCNSEGNDLIIYKPSGLSGNRLYGEWNVKHFSNSCASIESSLEEWHRFTFPRQKGKKNLCIADYFKTKSSGIFDVVAMQMVTVGKKASEYSQELFKSDQYSDYLFFHGLSVETAEALAEYWHKVIRTELGIAGGDAPELKKLFQQGYQGSRFSFGYPACPNLEDHKKLFDILKPERIGVELSEEFQLHPEQSTDAIIVHHPQAKYFFL